jgi:hypothetical protein
MHGTTKKQAWYNSKIAQHMHGTTKKQAWYNSNIAQHMHGTTKKQAQYEIKLQQIKCMVQHKGKSDGVTVA